MNVDTDLYPSQKLKWIIDLNVQSKTVKLLEDKIEHLDDLENCDNFLNNT